MFFWEIKKMTDISLSTSPKVYLESIIVCLHKLTTRWLLIDKKVMCPFLANIISWSVLYARHNWNGTNPIFACMFHDAHYVSMIYRAISKKHLNSY